MRKIALILMLLFVFGAGVGHAAIPRLINYQGRVTDTQGTPLTGSYSVTFRIYDAESAGNLLWEETHAGLVLDKGMFSVLLGSVTALNIPFDKSYFLEIKVGNEVMSPRQQIASSAYAMRAENTDSLPRGIIVAWSGKIADIPTGWMPCDGTNGTPDLRDKFIIGARQDDSGIAKTNVSGALTQVGGEAKHVLTIAEMPAHTHNYDGVSWQDRYDGGSWFSPYPSQTKTSTSTGGSQPHNILPPYYAVCFIMKS